MKNTSRYSVAALSDAQFDRRGNRTAVTAERNDRRSVLDGGANDFLEAGDHFVERDGLRYAGTHLIVDLWQASYLDDIDVVEGALRQAAEAGGATLLKLDLHSFSPSGGITGVAVLAESHISIHTWPERAYAAVDVFMCGDAEPHRTIKVLRRAFEPQMLSVSEHRRGIMP